MLIAPQKRFFSDPMQEQMQIQPDKPIVTHEWERRGKRLRSLDFINGPDPVRYTRVAGHRIWIRLWIPNPNQVLRDKLCRAAHRTVD